MRRFAAEALFNLGFDRRSFAAQATAAIRNRLPVEPDAVVLDSPIGAYVGHVEEESDLTGMLPFAEHPAAAVRPGSPYHSGR